MPASLVQHGSRWSRLSMLGMLGVALLAAPITFDHGSLEPSWQTAVAKQGSDKGGREKGGNGNHGGRHNGKNGGREIKGGGSDNRGHGHGRSDRSWGEVVDQLRSGKAFGLDRQDDRIAKAKKRYHGALDRREQRVKRDTAFDRDAGRITHRFSAEQTKDLISRGWKGRQSLDGFKNHGHRVRTMVALAKALGYDARVGALQAHFGTPYENGIAALQAELDSARIEAETDSAAATEVAELEAQLAAAIANAKPGEGPADDWATANLDVNKDGVVDRSDLTALGDAIEADDQEDDGGSDEAMEEGDDDPGVQVSEPFVN